MKPFIKHAIRRIADIIGSNMEKRLLDHVDDEKAAQLALANSYRMLAKSGGRIPSFAEAGFRKYSQFEEDGILLLLFSLISPRTRTCVEICAGDGRECCTANLIINHGWWGHLFDGNDRNVERGREFFASHKDTFIHPPKFTKAWITADNINELILASGIHGDVDLLSLDIDGVDYWIWEAITCIDPMVVVCETHNPVPADVAVTVPYRADFCCETEDFRSASLAAMTKLAAKKGYRLVGTHRYGFNAFFVRNGIGEEYFPEVSVASCLGDPYTRDAIQNRWPKIKDLPWHHV